VSDVRAAGGVVLQDDAPEAASGLLTHDRDRALVEVL
jgi:hypothetical protein